MKIDPNLLMTILTSTISTAVPILLYLTKIGKDIAICKNDIKWLKLKACQRRNEDFKIIEEKGE